MPNIVIIKGYYIVWVNILLKITCRKNQCLDYRHYLQRTTMGTNEKITYIWVDLLPFSSLSFMSFKFNHWCKKCLCHNSGYLWSYLLCLFRIIMGRKFNWGTHNITCGLFNNTLLRRYASICSTTWISIWTTIQFPIFHVPNFEVKTNARQGLKVGLCYLLAYIQVLRHNLYSFMPICPKNLTLIDRRPPISSYMFLNEFMDNGKPIEKSLVNFGPNPHL